jgi:AcrR family transcriptional regulator
MPLVLLMLLGNTDDVSATTATASAPDWRARRRAESIDEIVAVSLRHMSREGAGGLSLGAVARELGMRTPSLYTYFPSKAALYDEVFRRGWVEYAEATRPTPITAETDLRTYVAAGLLTSLEWAQTHRPYAELMFWRPIPGWEPTPESFAASLAAVRHLVDIIGSAQQLGLLTAEVETEEIVQVIGVVSMGLVSQHLSNEPRTPAPDGRLSRYIHSLADMVVGQYEGSPHEPGSSAGPTHPADPPRPGG